MPGSCEVTPVMLVPWFHFIKEILMLGRLSGNKDKEITTEQQPVWQKVHTRVLWQSMIGPLFCNQSGIKFQGKLLLV
jgi:hypothetical protein